MTPETNCTKLNCDNVAAYDSIYCGGGKLCVKHAQIEADELAYI